MVDHADLYDGVRFMEEKQYAKAIVSLDDIAQKKGECFEIYELQGLCYFNMGDWRNAVRTLATAISYLESPQPNLYEYKGLANLYLGEFSFSVNDLFLALRYTPVETLSDEADLLSNIFFACVLAGDERAQKVFNLGYGNCPTAMMENIQRLFDSFFIRLNVSGEEKIAMQEQINQLKEQAEEDQRIIEKMVKTRGERLNALIGNLRNLKVSKEPKAPINYESREKKEEASEAEALAPKEEPEKEAPAEAKTEAPAEANKEEPKKEALAEAKKEEPKKETPKEEKKEKKTPEEAAADFLKKVKSRNKGKNS